MVPINRLHTRYLSRSILLIAFLGSCSQLATKEVEPVEKLTVVPAKSVNVDAVPVMVGKTPDTWVAEPFVKSLPQNPQAGPDGFEGLRRTWTATTSAGGGVRTLRVKGEDDRWQARTPAMSAGLADHV